MHFKRFGIPGRFRFRPAKEAGCLQLKLTGKFTKKLSPSPAARLCPLAAASLAAWTPTCQVREGRQAGVCSLLALPAPELGSLPSCHPTPKPIREAHKRGAVQLPVPGSSTSTRTLRPSREAAAAAAATGTEVGFVLRLRGRPGREPLHVGAALEEGRGDQKTRLFNDHHHHHHHYFVLPVAQKGSPAPTP